MLIDQVTPAFTIKPARSEQDIIDARKLFGAYAVWLNIDLEFQNFAHELATLPGVYNPPKGEILLARKADGTAIGCVAVRPLHSEAVCEMKRLYILPDARGMGLGRALIEAIVVVARQSGYREMKLDTLGHLHHAIDLYQRCGFHIIEPYCANPQPTVMYFGKDLS